MKVHKNFLNPEEFDILRSIIESQDFPWFFNQGVISKQNNVKNYDFQFVHTFYDRNKENSSWMSMVGPILNKINPFSLLRVKANLTPKTEVNFEHGMHTDITTDHKVTTGVYYVNTCNGYTKFKDGSKVYSEANTYVEFDGSLVHTGSTCTDNSHRIVINFNYLK